MTPFLLDENSAIGLVINGLGFLLFAPLYIGLLVKLLARGPRNLKWGLILAVGLVFIWFGASWEGLLPIASNYYLFIFTFPLIVGLIRLLILKLSGKPPRP